MSNNSFLSWLVILPFCQVVDQSMNIQSHRMRSPTGKAIWLATRPFGGVSSDTLQKTVGAVRGGRGGGKIWLESTIAVST